MILIVVSIVLAVALTVGTAGYLLFFHQWTKVEYGTEYWGNIQGKETVLPALDELGNPLAVTCQCQQTSQAFFIWTAYTLTASYGEEDYQTQKEYFQNKYNFETTLPRFAEETVAKEPNFSLDGFEFSVLDFEKYSLDYPKKMVFVGFCDRTKEIVFVYFLDTDLDYIEGSFAEFLKDDCGWK